MSGLTAGTDYYFRVTAANAGGESFPSEVVGCRTPATAEAPRVLVVNAFDRFDRTTNLRRTLTAESYGAPDGSGAIERVWPQRVNAFDYVVPHGKAISAYGMAFDSCQNEAITGEPGPTVELLDRDLGLRQRNHGRGDFQRRRADEGQRVSGERREVVRFGAEHCL